MLLDYILKDNDFAKSMNEVVIPFIKRYENTGFFKSYDGTDLFYKKFELDNAKASFIIVHGFTENSECYNELIYYLLLNSYSVYIFDQRCHGLSKRLSDNYNTVTVGHFNDYIDDLEFFIKNIVHQNKIVLYGFSMGGAIVSRFLEMFPMHDNIEAVILSAPMLGLKTYKDYEAEGTKECPGSKSNKNQDEINKYASRNRSDYIVNIHMNNPKLITNTANIQWFKEALKATHEIFEEDNIKKITEDIILFQCAKDTTVLLEPQNKFVQLVKNCKLTILEKSDHNVFHMNSNIINEYMSCVFEFLNHVLT
jgi:lysophospholipase